MTKTLALTALTTALLMGLSAQAQEAAPSPAATPPAAAAEPAAPVEPPAPPVAETPVAATEAAPATTAPPTPPVTSVNDTPIPPPPEGKGQVVFFRPSGIGPLMGCTVREGEGLISKLANGKYFVKTFEPGAHNFTVKSEATDNLRLEVESGETYFVRCSISMGVMVGRPNLSPSNKQEFEVKAAKLKAQKES